MHLAGRKRAGLLTRALMAIGLNALAVGAASAQTYPVGYPNGMSVDGNIFWGSGANTSLANQATGAPSVLPPGCPAGYNAAYLITTEYTHNLWVDPLVTSQVAWPNGHPNFQPPLSSPAYLQAMKVPAGDPFFEQVCYVGAIGPSPIDDWTKDWTYYDSTGTGRDDLHLPGMTNPRPTVIHNNIILHSDQTWLPDTNHVVRGQFRVEGGANLTIAPGTVVIEERATLGTIRIDRSSKIFAVGKKDSVIIITTDDPPGTMHTGGCGGLVINGRAKINNANSCAGDSAASEGGAIGFYGGNDDHDSSGALKYVRIEYSGKEITPNNELNTFTNNAVGDATSMEFLQAHQGADDGWEAFGGTVRVKHLICTDGHDDGYDWQQGYRGGAQFLIVRGIADLAPSGTQFGDKAIEADNNDVAPFDQDIDAHLCSGQSNPIVYNATFVGDRSRSGAAFPGSTGGINLRRGTAGVVMNSIIVNFKTQGLKIDDDVTWKYHCRAVGLIGGAGPLFKPAVFCSELVGAVPIADGSVFLTRSSPTPFRNRLTITFALPQAGHVRVDVYTADGRLVGTPANGEMSAGPHAVEWLAGQDTPSGVYFYKVIVNGQRGSGKAVHVD
jgi:hypothetical protein